MNGKTKFARYIRAIWPFPIAPATHNCRVASTASRYIPPGGTSGAMPLSPQKPPTRRELRKAQSASPISLLTQKENPRLQKRSLGFFVGSFLGIAVDSRILLDESQQILLHGFFGCGFCVFRKKLFSFPEPGLTLTQWTVDPRLPCGKISCIVIREEKSRNTNASQHSFSDNVFSGIMSPASIVGDIGIWLYPS